MRRKSSKHSVEGRKHESAVEGHKNESTFDRLYCMSPGLNNTVSMPSSKNGAGERLSRNGDSGRLDWKSPRLRRRRCSACEGLNKERNVLMRINEGDRPIGRLETEGRNHVGRLKTGCQDPI